MGTDKDNHAGYERASELNKAETMTGQLLIIHGMIDENVHFRHTARMLTALTEARRQYSLLCLPETRHMPRGFNVLAMIAQRRSEFFLQHLQK
jgi:dipeptidyl-peptidase-4